MEITKKAKKEDVHSYIARLNELYRGGKITRRECIRNAVMFGVSASKQTITNSVGDSRV